MDLPKLNRGHIATAALLLAVLLIVGAVGWAFVEQLTIAQELHGEARRLENLVATREARYDELTGTLAFVQTDEYVEQWAREELKMARPGEVVVLPLVTAGGEQPEGAPPSEATGAELDLPDARPFWVVWWETLFPQD